MALAAARSGCVPVCAAHPSDHLVQHGQRAGAAGPPASGNDLCGLPGQLLHRHKRSLHAVPLLAALQACRHHNPAPPAGHRPCQPLLDSEPFLYTVTVKWSVPRLPLLGCPTMPRRLTHNPDYCSTQLLTHPLSQRRLRLAAGALDILLQPPPSAVGAVVTKSAHALDDRQACVAVFTLQQTLLGVLLPALAASWVPRPPLPGPEPTAAAAAESEGEQAGGRLWRHAARRARRACKSVAEACERANDALLHFCRSVCTPTGKHLVGIWLLCCELWLLAKVVAAHSA